MKVLIDSSSWIDFLREGGNRQPGVSAALKSGTALLCPVVWAELMSGMRGKREQEALKIIRQSCGWIDMDEASWDATFILRTAAKAKGVNCPLADVMIVACAKRHGAGLLHRDKHFDALLKLAV
ncbi:MAG: PIN domain nuclease [Akkermansiaceae bacterium]|nr:PIN domain nuclease [Akkermansiaceae bacterium]